MLGLKIVAAKAATAVMLATPLYTKVCTDITDFFIALYACRHVISWTQLQSIIYGVSRKREYQSYSNGFCGIMVDL